MGNWREIAQYSEREAGRIGQKAGRSVGKLDEAARTSFGAISLFDKWYEGKGEEKKLKAYGEKEGLEYDKETDTFTGSVTGKGSYRITPAELKVMQDKSIVSENSVEDMIMSDGAIRKRYGTKSIGSTVAGVKPSVPLNLNYAPEVETGDKTFTSGLGSKKPTGLIGMASGQQSLLDFQKQSLLDFQVGDISGSGMGVQHELTGKNFQPSITTGERGRDAAGTREAIDIQKAQLEESLSEYGAGGKGRSDFLQGREAHLKDLLKSKEEEYSRKSDFLKGRETYLKDLLKSKEEEHSNLYSKKLKSDFLQGRETYLKDLLKSKEEEYSNLLQTERDEKTKSLNLQSTKALYERRLPFQGPPKPPRKTWQDLLNIGKTTNIRGYETDPETGEILLEPESSILR